LTKNNKDVIIKNSFWGKAKKHKFNTAFLFCILEKNTKKINEKSVDIRYRIMLK